MKEQIKGSLILLLTATIWGFAFVAQSAGMDYIGGFTFNCIRSIIGGIVLIPCIFIIKRFRKYDESQNGCEIVGKKPEINSDGDVVKSEKSMLVAGGIACGVLLCIASNLQQQALKTAPVGKAGFITALYIVLVPVLGLFLKKKVGVKVAAGVVLAIIGLYLLCMKDGFGSVGMEDFLLLGCALFFSFHILTIDYFAPHVDCVVMSCIQFFVCGILSGIPMIMFEKISLGSILDAAGPILYAGVLSCGVAYTLQIVGQKNMNPTVASMILSLESVVSVLAGFLLLEEVLSSRELLGCVLMFAAIIISQLPDKKKTLDSF